MLVLILKRPSSCFYLLLISWWSSCKKVSLFTDDTYLDVKSILMYPTYLLVKCFSFSMIMLRNQPPAKAVAADIDFFDYSFL
ncbi:MAG: hypothetical protein QM802_06570 [Agriterribacter sp.]